MPPLSVIQGNDLNQWPAQLTQLSQDQTIPDTRYEKVKDDGRITEEKEGKEKEQKEKNQGDDEMQRDMVCRQILKTD